MSIRFRIRICIRTRVHIHLTRQPARHKRLMKLCTQWCVTMGEKSAEIEVAADDVQRYDVMMMFASMSHTEHTFCCRLAAQINVNDVKLLSQSA